MVRVEIDCDADDAIANLSAMKARAQAFQPIFEYARLELMKSNAENFSLGGLPSGSKWKPRSQVYPWPLMVRTGKLLASLSNLFGEPNKVDATEAVFGTKVEYAKFHQYGTTKMPKRQIVFEPRGFANDLAEKAAKYVAEGRFA
jgi:phage gpG-like protein